MVEETPGATSQSAKEYRRLRALSHHCAVLKQSDATGPKNYILFEEQLSFVL